MTATRSIAVSTHLSCLALDRLPEVEHFLAMPVAKLMHVTLHAAPKLVNVTMEALPCCLPAHADGSADRFPRRASGNSLADELNLPRGEQTEKRSRRTECCEWIRTSGCCLPCRRHQRWNGARLVGCPGARHSSRLT
jgi:hypothetical protein